jgi:hypothetical protein
MSDIRINIAKAALDLINKEKIIPTTGVYVDYNYPAPFPFDLDEYWSRRQAINAEDLGNALKIEGGSCYACMVGSLLCGASIVVSGFMLAQIREFRDMVNYLRINGFSYKELAKIEFALEGTLQLRLTSKSIEVKDDSDPEFELTSEEQLKVQDYIKTHVPNSTTPRDITVTILEYIINNEGKLPF